MEFTLEIITYITLGISPIYIILHYFLADKK